MMEEIWKDIKGYDGVYQVSNYGNIKTKYRIIYDINKKTIVKLISNKIKKCVKNAFGYYRVNLNKNKKIKSYMVHRLVAQAFIPNPLNKPQVNHINGIKTDNRVENLEWCNNSENQLHAVNNGLIIHRSRKFKMKDKETNETIMSFNNIKEVKKYLKINYCGCIYGVINKKLKTAYGYKWEAYE